MLKRTLALALLSLAPIAAMAAPARIIVPVAGETAGANNSVWQTDLTLHSSAADPIPLTLTYRTQSGDVKTSPITLAARETRSFLNIVDSTFNAPGTVGAIEIAGDDSQLRSVAAAARIFNRSASGTFGQDIEAFDELEGLGAGDNAVVVGPSDPAASRFNFGIYATDASSVSWKLLRADGSIAAEKQVSYAAGTQAQYTNGVSTLFGSEAAADDVVQLAVFSGRVFAYGSVVDNQTGDPTFVAPRRAHVTGEIQLLGVDMDENGTVDIGDANGDGVIDEPVALFTAHYPNYFRIIARDASGKTLTFTLVDSPADVNLLDADGLIQWYPGAEMRGKSGTLRVRAQSDSSIATFTVPVVFE